MLGFEVCVEACKSLILSCAVFEGGLGPEAAAELARLEVRYQVSLTHTHTHTLHLLMCVSLYRLDSGERWSGSMEWTKLTLELG